MAADEMLAPLFLEVAKVDTDTEAEALGDLWSKVSIAKKAMRNLSERLDAALLEWCDANGSFTVGELKFYAGTLKNTECTDKRGAMFALVEACANDTELLEVLVAQPYKFAAAREALGDRFPDFF